MGEQIGGHRPPAPAAALPSVALPRWIAAIFIGAIALASLTALVWPSLPFTRPGAGDGDVPVIAAQIEDAAAAGRVGAPAPNFTWSGSGGSTRLSDLRGGVVIVNFWATWCVPCRQEMPALDRIARSEPDVTVVEVDLQESGVKVRSFIDQLGLDRLVPVLDTDGATTRRFGVLSLPSTFFIDRDGIIRHVELGGPLSDAQIRQGLAKAR